MIFSNKIYKINDGINSTLFAKDENTLNLYLFNKTLRKYEIRLNNNKNCIFSKMYNYKKLIQLNHNIVCPCNSNYITLTNEIDL